MQVTVAAKIKAANMARAMIAMMPASIVAIVVTAMVAFAHIMVATMAAMALVIFVHIICQRRSANADRDMPAMSGFCGLRGCKRNRDRTCQC